MVRRERSLSGQNSAYLDGTAEGTSHIGAVQIFAKIHKCEKSAEDARLEIVGKREAAGSYARQALAVLGDELHDFTVTIVRRVAKSSLATHPGTTIFQRQSEMQHAQAMLAQSSRNLEFAVLHFAITVHGAPRGVHDR